MADKGQRGQANCDGFAKSANPPVTGDEVTGDRGENNAKSTSPVDPGPGNGLPPQADGLSGLRGQANYALPDDRRTNTPEQQRQDIIRLSPCLLEAAAKGWG